MIYNFIIHYAYPYMNIIFLLETADTSASAPPIELQNHTEINQMPSNPHYTTKEPLSASQVTRNVCEITLRPEELKAQDSELCNICMVNQIDCLILECGHMSTCLICAKELLKCPICRQQISRIVKAFKS